MFVEKIAAWRAGIDRQENEAWLLKVVAPKILALTANTRFVDPALTPSDLRSVLEMKLITIVSDFRGNSIREFVKYAETCLMRAKSDLLGSQSPIDKAKKWVDTLIDVDVPVDPGLSPATQAFTREVSKQVDAFIDTLPDPLDRQVLWLVAHNGMKPAEIAREVGQEYGKVWRIYQRLLQQLRDHFGEV